MTTLSKTDAEALVDRLADKSLTFGCVIGVKLGKRVEDERVLAGLNEHGEYVFFTDDKLSTYTPWSKGFCEENCVTLGHPILKCHVEQKILEADSERKIVAPCTLIDRLTRLWMPCGLTNPLQSILAKIEWEEEAVWYAGAPTGASVQVAKPSPETDLILFIKNLGL